MITTSKSFTVCAERADQIARIVAAFGERRDVIIAIDFNDADETITVHIDDDSQPYDRQYVFEIGSDDDALVFVNPDDINDSVIIPLD